MTSNQFFEVFEKSILDYHIYDSIEQNAKNPYNKEDFKFLLYQKNWIDTVQWHLEDIIRDPSKSNLDLLGNFFTLQSF